MIHFSRLLDAVHEADADLRLSPYLGHDVSEVADWPERRDTMIDGLDRSICDGLVLERALRQCDGDADMAATISETISTIVPLARSIEEVDQAISSLHTWYAGLIEDGLFANIVEVKRFARDERLLDQDTGVMDAETLAAWNASVAILQHHLDLGETTVLLGGHEVVVTVETGGIDVLLQESTGGDDFLAIYTLAYPGSDGGGRWSGGPDDGDPEPEDADGPRPRSLIDA